MAMTSRERVLTALRHQAPDRVPYCEFGIDRALAHKLMGWPSLSTQAASLETNPYTVDEIKSLAASLGMDNIYYVWRAPVFAERIPGQDGRLFYGEGLIKTEADLPNLQLPDPHDDAFYLPMKAFVEQKGGFAACFVTRIGPFSTWLSMGLENFAYCLYENRSFVERVLDTYCDWAAVVAERVCSLGFDVFVSTDDMAFKTQTVVSPKVFRSLFMPRYRRVREHITLPWVVHSDGNLMPILDDLVDLGIAGLHPIEKGAMDIRAVKRAYGDRICLFGNVDLNLLGAGTPAEVDREVQELIRDVGPGGGYIISSGNSLAGYLDPDNVRALAAAIKRYGAYPL